MPMTQLDRLEFKAAFTADDTGAVTGKAWDFSSPDRVGDVIEPTAFAGAIGKSLPMLFAHDQAQAVGVWDSITVGSDGLHVAGKLLVDDVARAKEVRALLQAKAVTGLSVGFMTKKAAPRSGGGRTISDLDLVEVSLVAVPAHDGARVSTVKDMPMTAAIAENLDTKAISDLDAKLTARLDQIEAAQNRLAADNDNKPEAEVETKALVTFLRSGVASLSDEEKKTLNLGTPAAGGYVTAPTISTTIIEKLVEFSPIRQLASVMSIGTTEVWLPKLATSLAGGWVTETGARPASEPTFDQQKISVFEHAVTVPVSLQLMEDSFIDLQGYLAGQIATAFGKAESVALVKGDGNGKPTGLLKTPADFAQVTAKQDASDIIAKVIELFYSLPGAYAARGSWLMNRQMQGIIRAAADTATKGNLWSDSLANGTPATLLGRPVYDAVDFDNLKPASAGTTYPIAFGDIASTYQVVDRVGVQIMRDDYTGADNGIVKIRARRRVGGAVVLPEATVLMKSAA